MSTINRFLSRRDKSTHHKKQPENHLKGLFEDDHTDTKKHQNKEGAGKIKIIASRLEKLGVTSFKDSDIGYTLNSTYASGDVDRAYDLILLIEESEKGHIRPYDPDIKLLGAVNRESVTCYLDALLFAMFARLGSFEAMLCKQTDDQSKRRLATLLRLWVNMLRAGKLITVDITKQLQIQLAGCGFKEAAELCQQDASESFTFITSTLLLPLLTLKMDIYHTGKEDASDDHKFINERLLELAIPDEPPDGTTITLEDCLEMYFNNRIEVKRHLDFLERRNTLNSVRSRANSTKAHASHIEIAEINISQPSSPIAPTRPAFGRQRGTSIIQEHYIDEKRGCLTGSDDGHSLRLKKEVMMPAWQFYSLIPWYTDSTPQSDAQVAAHFSRERPILGMCLKRYSSSENGAAIKRTTRIDVPLEIALPHFISDDEIADDGPAFGNFKMSLQSVVCHRGLSIDSGHYISLVRCPGQLGEDRWMRFDDLANQRVAYIDVEVFLRDESPYLLFYQITPIGAEDVGEVGSQMQHDGPPSYAESNKSERSMREPSVEDFSNSTKTSYEASVHTSQMRRPSYDIRQPSSETSISLEDIRRGRTSMTSNRHQSISSSTNNRLAAPSIDNNPGHPSESKTNQNVSRRPTPASSKSRPSSQTGDNRLSASLSRIASRMSRDRLDKAARVPAQAENPSSTAAIEEPKTTASSAPLQKADIIDTKHLALVDVVHEATQGGHFKENSKEKRSSRLREHGFLAKAKGREDRPDRECSVM